MPEAPPQPKKNVFSSKEEVAPNVVSDIAAQLNNTSRATRTLEDRYTTLRNKVQVNEQNMLTNDKKFVSELRVMSSELMELKTDLNDLKEKLTLLVKELKLSATKEEVKVLQKYISYWEPLSFVTHAELDKFLSEHRL